MSNPIFRLNSNRTELAAAEAELIDQIPSQTPDAKFMVNGVIMTATEYVELLKRHRAMMTATNQARTAFHEQVAAEEQMRVAVRDGAVAYRGYVVGTYGATSTTMTNLGLVPSPRLEPTLEVKVAAADKSRATRAMRHTMGKRQRARVHGVVPAPASPPQSEPAEPPSEPASPVAPLVTGSTKAA